MLSAFGVDHDGSVSKKKDDNTKRNVAVGGAGVAATGVAATKVQIPEHSHYDKKTRAKLHKLPAGVHEVDTKMLAKRPRKLGARKQQTPYVAAMAQERPVESFKNSPVPITRYKGGHAIQRDNAHSVMANAMKGRKTLIKIEDAPGHRPNRSVAEELVRRGQMRFQEQRLKRAFKMTEKDIEAKRAKYKDSSRAANTHKRPHGVVEEEFKYSPQKFGVKQALGAGKNLKMVAKRDDRGNRDTAAGVLGAGGVGALAATPVRRSAAKVDIKDGQISAKDAKKIANPGARPGNTRSIKVMARNLGHLENKPPTVVRYKDGTAIPYDGNHRMTARVARGDKTVPVNVIEGTNRPAVSAARNAFHVTRQRIHRQRMDAGDFTPNTKAGDKGYTGKHAGETKAYGSMANASPSRSGRRAGVSSASRVATGPSNKVLRTKQGVAIATGGALLTGAAHLKRDKK